VNRFNTVVLAIPRGGVVIGDVIASALGLNLDIIISRKIGPEIYVDGVVVVTEESRNGKKNTDTCWYDWRQERIAVHARE